MTHRAVFLDRDDTLISDPGYINHPAQVKLLPGTGQSLAMLKKMGYLLVIVTNQSGIARGLITEEGLEAIHHHLKKLLADEGVYIDAIYHCPYHPEGTVEKYTRQSDLRKPAPGMLLKAAEELRIDLSQSWMIGDSYRDIAAGHRAGCRTILLDTPGKPQVREPNDPEPDKRAVNLREAVNILRMFEFQQKAQAARTARGLNETETETKQTVETPAVESADDEETAPAAETVLPSPVLPEPEAEPETESEAEPKAEPVSEPLSEPEAVLRPPAKPVNSKNPEPAPPAVTSQTTAPPVVATADPEETSDAVARSPEDPTTHRLLEEILHRVKSKNRYDQYAEFSVFMLLAWLVQALAAFSLVLSVWFWLDKEHGVESVQTMIGYAAALELLVIALLMMHEKSK